MRNVALRLRYDGSRYHGWQVQKGDITVAQTLEEALGKVCGHPVKAVGCGRTDAGVHALCQVCAFDTASRIPAEKFSYALNTLLPDDIRVRESLEADSDFHPRFQAHGKIYRYQIYNSPHASALLRCLTAHVPVRLAEGAMQAAAAQLIGTHDFAAFAAAGGSAKTTVRTIDFADVRREEDMVTLRVHGNAFLYNMVRIIAGALIGVGQGKLPADCIATAIRTGSRLDLGVTAPACGLELTRVEYDFER